MVICEMPIELALMAHDEQTAIVTVSLLPAIWRLFELTVNFDSRRKIAPTVFRMLQVNEIIFVKKKN